MKFCSNCGRTYGDENDFCSECGTILKVKAAPSSNSNDSTSTQNPTENIIINSIKFFHSSFWLLTNNEFLIC